MFSKFLLAFDGSREGREALHEAASLARAINATVQLVAVVNLAPVALMTETTFAARVIEDEEADMRRALDEGLAELRSAGLQADATLSQGVNPAEDIARIARDVGADLIVLGHRDQGALERLWNGSVGRHLVAHAPCSVLIAVARSPRHDSASAAA